MVPPEKTIMFVNVGEAGTIEVKTELPPESTCSGLTINVNIVRLGAVATLKNVHVVEARVVVQLGLVEGIPSLMTWPLVVILILPAPPKAT